MWRRARKFPVDHLDLKKYESQGVDISLIIANLRRTPTERYEGNKNMLRFIEEARKDRLKRHGHS